MRIISLRIETGIAWTMDHSHVDKIYSYICKVFFYRKSVCGYVFQSYDNKVLSIENYGVVLE